MDLGRNFSVCFSLYSWICRMWLGLDGEGNNWSEKTLLNRNQNYQEFSHFCLIFSSFGCLYDVISLYDSGYVPETVGCSVDFTVRGNIWSRGVWTGIISLFFYFLLFCMFLWRYFSGFFCLYHSHCRMWLGLDGVGNDWSEET